VLAILQIHGKMPVIPGFIVPDGVDEWVLRDLEVGGSNPLAPIRLTANGDMPKLHYNSLI
jgi:hypothetical protein